jgi:hypothetical protein
MWLIQQLFKIDLITPHSILTSLTQPMEREGQDRSTKENKL